MLIGARDASKHVDVAAHERIVQIRPRTVHVFAGKARVAGNFFQILVAITAFRLTLGGAFLKAARFVIPDFNGLDFA